MTLSYAPFGIWPICLASLVVAIYVTDTLSTKRAAKYGFVFGFGWFALGISWGDDVPDEIPLMVQPNTIPTLTQFQNATPAEREIMLAEMASSGGYSSNEAVKLIIEGAPGGNPSMFRRPSVLGQAR